MKIGVLIGRFQVPEPHEGHRFLLKRVSEMCDQLLILVGSSNRASSVKNPYSFAYRRNKLSEIVPKAIILPLNDYPYNDSQWMVDVAKTIEYVAESSPEPVLNISLFGHYKEGNDYLKWFPQYQFENIDSSIEVSGTEIRSAYRHLLPKNVQVDMAYFEKEESMFSTYPYPGTLNFNCADAVVECSGHVLLIQRGHAPGAGTWALPGGFKNSNETFLQAAIRELYEETNLRVPKKVVLGSIKATQLFDSPTRGSGIPRNTVAVRIVIQPDPSGSLPRANGGDDAALAKWVSIYDALNNYVLHDDHADIISTMTGTMPVIAYNNPRIVNPA